MRTDIHVVNCSACGGDHPHVLPYRLEQPEFVKGEWFSEAFVCPDVDAVVYVQGAAAPTLTYTDLHADSTLESTNATLQRHGVPVDFVVLSSMIQAAVNEALIGFAHEMFL